MLEYLVSTTTHKPNRTKDLTKNKAGQLLKDKDESSPNLLYVLVEQVVIQVKKCLQATLHAAKLALQEKRRLGVENNQVFQDYHPMLVLENKR